MRGSSRSLAICAILLLISLSVASVAAAASGVDHHQLGWLLAPPECSGSIAECMVGGEDEEFLMDSETNRRILAARRYISYGALSRNRVPCSRRGASYYNCRRGGQANPYSRGCNRITRCRR